MPLTMLLTLFDATFEERLKVAYQDAKENEDSYFGRYDGGANVTESEVIENTGHGVPRNGLHSFRYQRSLESRITPVSVKKIHSCTNFLTTFMIFSI